MRSTVLLANLALISTTLAFYPFVPDYLRAERESRRGLDGKGIDLTIKQRNTKSSLPPAERAALAAERLSTKYNRGQLSTPVEKRDNNFGVLRAADPQRDQTTGIHQDGYDMSYFIEVKLGSQGKNYYMLVDTGAGSSWIMGQDCDTEACRLHNTFGTDDSSSLNNSDREFHIVYGTGEVNGTLITDTLSIAGIDLRYQLGLAGATSQDFVNFAFDGILGFSMDHGVNENLLEALIGSGQLDDNLFAIALHRAQDGNNVGQLSLGSINPDKYTGDISYNSLMPGDEWTIELDDMHYGGEGADVGGIRSYIDSGTSYIFGPPDQVANIHRLIPGAESSDRRTWTVPCDSEDTLEFAFGGERYAVSSKDWISSYSTNGRCTSNIYGVEVVRGSWLLGDTFLKNVYAVFDVDGRRIGFAPAANGQSNSPSSTESSTVTSTSSQPSSTSGQSNAETSSSFTGTSSPGDASTTGPDRPSSTGQVTEGTTGPEDTEGGSSSGAEDGGDDDSAASHMKKGGISILLSVALGAALIL